MIGFAVSSSSDGFVGNPCIPRGYKLPLNASYAKPLASPAGNFSACRYEALALLKRKEGINFFCFQYDEFESFQLKLDFLRITNLYFLLTESFIGYFKRKWAFIPFCLLLNRFISTYPKKGSSIYWRKEK